MSKHVIGLVLIDAPHSALNNAGTEPSQATENIVVVKTLRKGNQTYPYVSGQAWRNWWRTTLDEEFNWEVSPIERDKKLPLPRLILLPTMTMTFLVTCER